MRFSAGRFTARSHIGLIVLSIGFAGASPTAADHPRLLLSSENILAMRHDCGLERDPRCPRRFGGMSNDFNRVRNYLLSADALGSASGDLLALAFCRLVEGAGARASSATGKLQPDIAENADLLELALYLDWSWYALSPGERTALLDLLRPRLVPLSAGDSPLNERAFRDKLGSLALALAIDEIDEPGASWAARRGEIFDAARKYFADTFPAFVDLRGLSPTTPADAADEEFGTVLGVELASKLLGPAQWRRFAPSVGRWLEHYVCASVTRSAHEWQFIRDRAGSAPLPPGSWNRLLPLTAALLRSRTNNPAAHLAAERVALLAAQDELGAAARWCWLAIAFPTTTTALNLEALTAPGAHDLGGAVVLRGSAGEREFVVWVEAGQPFLRRGQHFDAGHFLIRAGGDLVVSAGEDIALEAVSAKGGVQGLGRDEGFDFEQFYVSSIAHNCILLPDVGRFRRYYGERFQPVGGQRVIEDTCREFGPPNAHARRTVARRLAFESRPSGQAYLALDLTPAYDTRGLDSCTREFLFCSDYLLVIDRVRLSGGKIAPVALLNIPARPQVDQAALASQRRSAGQSDAAGIWHCDSARWLSWSEGSGALWCGVVAPAERRVRVVGGPATPLRVASGPFVGRAYVGGASDSFERLIGPATGRQMPRNAWFKLGAPTALGTEVGRTPHWGRIEVESEAKDGRHCLVMVLSPDGAERSTPPALDVTTADDELRLTLSNGRRVDTIALGRHERRFVWSTTAEGEVWRYSPESGLDPRTDRSRN